MNLIFEIGKEGRGLSLLPKCDVPETSLPENMKRQTKLHLPELSENEISRHYTKLAQRTHGVNNGFYPLGSCTMKYNPKVNEYAASLKGFTRLHPLQEEKYAQGALEVMQMTENSLSEILGMDAFTLQPAAGAHGEFTGLLLIKSYHTDRGDTKRTKIIVPDSAHGTNPASAAMCGPNTVGLFDKNILEITKIVHEAGGLCYYDGANLNAVMGQARPGDMGFDCVHVNLHKTFSTPHGGGGPGSGPVGCKAFLADFLPGARVTGTPEEGLRFEAAPKSMGLVKEFYGNFLVVVKALSYILTLGKEGIPEASANAVLNANYMRVKLSEKYEMAYDTTCMHEFVMDLAELKHRTGVSALDVAKGLLDYGIHPPTMYFPLIVHEALMVEPCETEPREVMDEAVNALLELYDMAEKDPEYLHGAPHKAVIGRPDELGAARNPVVRYTFED